MASRQREPAVPGRQSVSDDSFWHSLRVKIGLKLHLLLAFHINEKHSTHTPMLTQSLYPYSCDTQPHLVMSDTYHVIDNY